MIIFCLTWHTSWNFFLNRLFFRDNWCIFIIFLFSFVILNFYRYKNWLYFYNWFFLFILGNNRKSSIEINSLLICRVIQFWNYLATTMEIMTYFTNTLGLTVTESTILLSSLTFAILAISTYALIINRALMRIWKLD